MAGLDQQILDALDAIHGVHEGRRTQHAKGTLIAGTFTATSEAAGLSRAAHLQGDPVRVTVRFSNGASDPTEPDNSRRDGRGMAVKFYLPDGSTTDIVGLTLPVFFVRTAQDFLDFARARATDPETGKPDFAKIGEFVGAHPETGAALQLILPSLCAPLSYATCAYNSLHAFYLVDADGSRRAGRYRWEPEAGEHRVPDEEVDGRDADYLQTEIAERVAGEGAAFRLFFTLAEDGDDLADPTVAWPQERERVEFGRLELTGIDTTREQDPGDVLVFDPARLTDGIDFTGDDIVKARSDVYALSVLRRTGVARA